MNDTPKTDREAMKPKPIETAPKDGTPIIAFWEETGHAESVYWHDSLWIYEYDGLYPDYNPTHWIPKPKIPQITDSDNE